MARKLFITVILALMLSGCDRGPIPLIFENLPEGSAMSEEDRAAITLGLTKFLNLQHPPGSIEIKASGANSGMANVCGLLNKNLFFIGYLYRGGKPVFEVKHVTNTSIAETTYDLSVYTLCRR